MAMVNAIMMMATKDFFIFLIYLLLMVKTAKVVIFLDSRASGMRKGYRTKMCRKKHP